MPVGVHIMQELFQKTVHLCTCTSCITSQIQIKTLTTLPFFFLWFLVPEDSYENLKCAVSGELIFPSIWRSIFGLYNTRSNFIQNIAIFKFFLYILHFIIVNVSHILLECNCYLNPQLNWNIYSPLIVHFRFSNVVLRNRKYKKKMAVLSEPWLEFDQWYLYVSARLT